MAASKKVDAPCQSFKLAIAKQQLRSQRTVLQCGSRVSSFETGQSHRKIAQRLQKVNLILQIL